MNAVLYCDPRSLNDATNYYCGIIKKCVLEKGYNYCIAHTLNVVKNADLVITITEKYFLKAKVRYPSKKTIYWAQGVDAEETKMQINSLTQVLRYLFRRIAESFAVNNADLLFCVSDRMVQYYEKKYGYHNSGNVVVMPCYNLQLSSEFNTFQYETPVFVYAGNTSVWQNVDFMLDVYALVEKQISGAEIRVFTRQVEEFQMKIIQRNIKRFLVEYIPVERLQDELHKCKYGFIIRDNHIVNQVATPTKMNSYLAAYLIPIFSDGVDDFKKNISLGQYTIMAKCPLDVNEVANMIVNFENNQNEFEHYKAIVERVFDDHYNDSKYAKIVSRQINKYILDV